MEGEELLEIAGKLDEEHRKFERDYAPALRRLCDTAATIGRAWSGSNIGYHACVYYDGFQPPPPGAHFSVEWGLRDGIVGPATRGNWREHRQEDVVAAIEHSAGNANLSTARAESRQLAGLTDEARAALMSPR